MLQACDEGSSSRLLLCLFISGMKQILFIHSINQAASKQVINFLVSELETCVQAQILALPG